MPDVQPDALFLQNIDPENDVDFFRVDLHDGDRVILDIDDGNDEADGSEIPSFFTS